MRRVFGYLMRLLIVLTVLIGLTLSPAIGASDPLIEYLFWKQMGKQAGNAVNSYNEYESKRLEMESNIVRLESELQKCGDCPERTKIEKELNYWEGTRDTLNTMVRRTLYAIYDKETAEFFGNMFNIDMYEYQMPPGVKSAPELCQKLYKDYADCLHEHNVHGLADVCQDQYKISTLCKTGEEPELIQAINVVEMRKQGIIVPEVRDYSHTLEIYYGDVPDNFVPDMPPAQDLLATKKIYKVTMRKKTPGNLDYVNVGSFRQVPGVSMYDFHGKVQETFHEDRVAVVDERIITCRYRNPNGTNYSRTFWYARRPQKADPSYLEQRWAQAGKKYSSHPLLIIGPPITECPPTTEAAKAFK